MSQFNDSDGGSNQSFNGKYSLNFAISHKDIGRSPFDNSSMLSNIISETTLEDEYILLKKKSLLKRKFINSEKLYYREILELDLVKPSSSSLYSSIRIVYSKNGYSKRYLSLSSSDSFAVRWFYDALVVRYSYIKSNLANRYDFDSNESDFIKENDLDKINDDDYSDGSALSENLNSNDSSGSSDDSNSSNGSSSVGSGSPEDSSYSINSNSSKHSKQSKLSDFMSQMNKELSEDEKRKLKKKMQLDRCSSGEY